MEIETKTKDKEHLKILRMEKLECLLLQISLQGE